MTRLRQLGFTIIEMLIAMLIGSMLIVAVMLVLGGMTSGSNIRPGAEGSRRTLGSVADLDQSATIAMFQVDKWVRSAGTGLSQLVKSPYTYSYGYGCKLFAAKSSTQILPLTTALPAPFASLAAGGSGTGATSDFRLIPALIVPGGTTPGTSGQASDALVLMSSGNGYGEVPLPFNATATASQLTVFNTVAFSGANANDVALVADTQPDSTTGGPVNCMITQAALTTTDGSATTMPLGGTWFLATIGTQALTSYSSSGVVLDLGDPSATSAQPPMFYVIGVGDNDTLYSYDLLGIRAPQLQARGQNVFEMHALYGVDTDGDGKVDAWVKGDSTNYTVTKLTAGTIAASNLIKTIKAVRVGLILRTDLPERDAVSTSSTLTLFSDLGSSAFTRSLSSSEMKYRYRTIEATIPIRNNSF